MKSKKVKKYVIICFAIICIIFSCLTVYYFATTMSVNQCIKYCIEHTERNATKFSRVGDGRYVDDYAYFIAADGDPKKPQEIFIFKQKNLGSSILDRYVFVMSSVQSDSEKDNNSFGAIQFFTRNDKGEKEGTATLLFYGAYKDSTIASYEYKLTVREGSNIYKSNILNAEDIWFLKFTDLCDYDETRKKMVSDVKFYNVIGELVGEY